jgi:chemosensory pili system protein ChpC
MSKKRRPHKPGPFHRPPMQVAAAVAAPPSDAVHEEVDEPAEAALDVLDVASADAAAAGSTAPATAAAASGTASGSGSPVASVASPAAPSRPPADAATAATEPPALTDIRGVLIQVAGARLLLPNATIAEVLSYADPEPVGGEAPDWLLGRMRWRGWQLPLIAFGRLAGVAEEKAALGTKVVVLKALAGTGRTPYFALLTQGFPRLVTVSRGGLELEDDRADAMPRGVQARVRLNENEALLPDLDAVEALVAEALERAA